MANSIAHVTIGVNECKFVKPSCTYIVEKYVYGLKPTDTFNYEVSDYIYSVDIKPTNYIYNEYCKVIITLPVKPYKNMQIKIIINR